MASSLRNPNRDTCTFHITLLALLLRHTLLTKASFHISLRHLSIPNFPGSAAASTSGTCSPAFSTFSTTDGTSLADSEMPFELDSPDHRDEDESMSMDNYTYAHQQQQQQHHQQPVYDSYNGQGWYEEDHMAGRYTGNNGDNYASKLENIMGHA
jgi:hypothetical protein